MQLIKLQQTRAPLVEKYYKNRTVFLAKGHTKLTKLAFDFAHIELSFDASVNANFNLCCGKFSFCALAKPRDTPDTWQDIYFRLVQIL